MTTDRTTQYALDVLADKIVAGDLVKAACQRHIDDMKAAEAALMLKKQKGSLTSLKH